MERRVVFDDIQCWRWGWDRGPGWLEGSEATELSKLSKRAFPSPKTGPGDSPGDGAESSSEAEQRSHTTTRVFLLSRHYMESHGVISTLIARLLSFIMRACPAVPSSLMLSEQKKQISVYISSVISYNGWIFLLSQTEAHFNSSEKKIISTCLNFMIDININLEKQRRI